MVAGKALSGHKDILSGRGFINVSLIALCDLLQGTTYSLMSFRKAFI
jgi:hypothetical protein